MFCETQVRIKMATIFYATPVIENYDEFGDGDDENRRERKADGTKRNE